MAIALHVITYASLFVFVVAVAMRFRRIQNYPLNLRWEIYPVPHEGKRAEHGGSRLEETDWWTKPHKPNKWMELKFMIPEMILIKALYENNRKLWYRSFPFHFGMYLMAGFVALVMVSAVLELTGVPFDASAGASIGLLKGFTTVVGLAGLVLTILGGLGLLVMRLTDDDLKPYTTLSHHFNLLFIIAGSGLLLAAWGTTDRDFSMLRGYTASLMTFNLAAPTGSALLTAACLTLSLLVAYIPLTHMSHFFVKWFTWHKIRWDDEPNVKGGRIEVLIEEALQAPVTWSANHIKANGKKSWADIATEEMEQ